MMKKSIFLGAFAVLLTTFGCQKEFVQPGGEQSEIYPKERVSAVNIELGGDVANTIEEREFDDVASNSRNLNYGIEKVGENKGKVKLLSLDEKSLYSLCVIRPKTGATDANTYYVKLTWKKKKGENYFFVKEKTVTETTGKTITIDTKKEWQICGILTHTEANVKSTFVDFEPNKTAGTALALGGTDKVIKDVPLYFDWHDVKVDNKGFNLFNPENKAPAKIHIKPLGVMVRVSITNHAKFAMRMKELRFESNGLVTGAGKLGWEPASGLKPTIIPVSKAYIGQNEGVGNESVNTFPITTNVDIEPEETYAKSFLVWAFPKDLRADQADKKYTKVMVSAKRLEGGVEKNYPVMNHLYGFWSTTNNINATSSQRYHIGVTLYRPKLPLEYLTGYVKPNGQFGEGNALYMTTGQYKNFSRQGYRKVTRKDIRGIIGLFADVTFENKALIEKTMENFHVGGKPLEGNYKIKYQNGASDIFALSFDDGETGKRLYYTISRFTDEDNSGTLQAFYLGPNYKGTFEETRTPAFMQKHRTDIVLRRYYNAASNTTSISSNIGYNSGSETLVGKVLLTFIEPRGDYDYSLWRIRPTNDTRVSQEFSANITIAAGRKKDRTAPAVLMHNHDNFEERYLY